MGSDLTDSVAFFCSKACLGDLILKAQDSANERDPDNAQVVGGFYTPIERDVLRILLRGGPPITMVLARAVQGYRMSPRHQSGRYFRHGPDHQSFSCHANPHHRRDGRSPQSPHPDTVRVHPVCPRRAGRKDRGACCGSRRAWPFAPSPQFSRQRQPDRAWR